MVAVFDIGRLAQLDRVQASEAWGRGFESRAAHHFMMKCIIPVASLLSPTSVNAALMFYPMSISYNA
jgi:hypothetical protein